jgi:hypothetical protein
VGQGEQQNVLASGIDLTMAEKATPSGLNDADMDYMVACTEFVGRLGAETFELRWSDPEELVGKSPTVWFGIAGFKRPSPIQRNIKIWKWEVAASLQPQQAMYRLLELLVDGGQCTHCKRMTGVSDSLDTMPWNKEVCWYQYDPELKTFRRGCE